MDPSLILRVFRRLDNRLEGLSDDSPRALELHKLRKEALHSVLDGDPVIRVTDWGKTDDLRPHERVEIALGAPATAVFQYPVVPALEWLGRKLAEKGVDTACGELAKSIVAKLIPKQEAKQLLDFTIELPDGTQVGVDPPDRSATIGITFADGSVQSLEYQKARGQSAKLPERRDEEEAAAAEPPEALRRTPHMDVSHEAPLGPGIEFEVHVSVDTKPAKPGEKVEQEVELKGAPSQEEFPVQVTLIVSGHFELLDESIKPMTILRSAESAPVVFKVRCAQVFPAELNAALSALFTYEGHPSGRVTRHFRVENGKLVSVLVTQPAGAATRSAALEPKLAFTPGLEAYDLTISVLDTGENDNRHFRLIADAPGIGKRLDVPWNLGEKTAEIVSNHMKRFVAKGLTATTRLAELTGAGVQLFRATPPDFQKLFWEMIDTGKPPKTIMVVSEDPYIPWELMVPRRTLPGKVETRKPLGVEFSVGRWIRSDYITAPQQIPLERTYVIAPNYVNASKNLKWAPEEAKFVCASFQPSKAIDPADLEKIKEALREQGATLLHFICHGAAGVGTDQTVYLRDMENNLSCSVVEGLDEFVTTVFRDHTFVFLNACEVGRAAPALVGINGLATTFLRLGASGVVAALWSVKDDIAHEVAETFYTKVLQDPQTPFAEVLRDIRSKAYTVDAEDTYAAYCFYGSPLARRKIA